VIRAVTFDAAGTLITPREPVGRTYARAARALGMPADEIAVERAFRAAFRAAPPLAFAGTTDAARADHERAWWHEIVRTALAVDVAQPAFETCFETLYDHYAHAAAWTVYPDVRPSLEALRRRGLRTAVVSNFDRRLEPLLDALELRPAFDAVVWSSDVGAAKPSPAIFLHAVRRLGVAPAETVHVGDDPDADVAGATRAGLRAVHLDRSGRHPDALTTLATLDRRLALH
jgi:putative hydrolase of the HAD superfamily